MTYFANADERSDKALDAIEMRDRGMSWADIGTTLARRPETLRKYIRELGYDDKRWENVAYARAASRRARVAELWREGVSQRQIARITGASGATIANDLRLMREQ